MQTRIKRPIEVPNQREREMNPNFDGINQKLIELLTQKPEEQPEEPETPLPRPKIAISPEDPGDGGDPDIIVRLSWENDKETVINRMKNHMEAFPETKEGFLVYYNYTNNWFKVEIYNGKWDSDIIIDGIKYDIIPYEFSEEQVWKINQETMNTKLSHILYSDENGYPTLNLEKSI